jgi:hypothetical protein
MTQNHTGTGSPAVILVAGLVTLVQAHLEPSWAKYAAAVAAIALTAFALVNILTADVDPREPPIIRPRLPLFGHLLGIMTRQVGYFSDLQ